MHIDLKYIPSNDRIFGIMFQDAELYKALLKAIFGKEFILLEGAPISQAQKTEDVRLNIIKFDTLAVTNNGIYTIDMQRPKYSKEHIMARTLYYSCRLISNQPVKKMKYELLRPVAVSFILQEDKTLDSDGIRYASLHWEDNHEKCSSLLTLAMVYVPTVLKKQEHNTDLYIFADFFAVKTQKQMDKFEQDYGKTVLGRELMNKYGLAIADRETLARLEKEDSYYTMKDMEDILEEAREEERKEAFEKMLNEKLMSAQFLLSIDMPIEQVSQAVNIPLDELKEHLNIE